MRSKILGLLAATALTATVGAAAAAPVLAPVFTDHAVLQRGQPIRVWGGARPGEAVILSLGDAEATATADAQGRWFTTFPAREPGAALTLTAKAGGDSQTISDLLVGDVWLCSGQSNMEYPLRRALGGEAEAAKSADPDIRLLQTGRTSLPAPTTALPKEAVWRVASPESANNFSAACFFMGRDIKKTTGIPVGLIDATWGGSVIQDWISREGLHALGGYDEGLQLLAEYAKSPDVGMAHWSAMLDRWAAKAQPQAAAWSRTDFDDRDWKTMPAELFWETNPGLESFDGTIWLRATITLTAQQAKQGATLSLGPIDDLDTTFVNGRGVGTTQGWNKPREYRIAPGVLKAGPNLIAVRAIDTGGGGGAWGPAAEKGLKLDDGAFVPLGGTWRYKVAESIAHSGLPPTASWVGSSGLSTLRNGMIAPLAPYGLKGFAWYQGEANVAEPAVYARLLPAMIADWRKAFGGPDLPFLIVQLADFGSRNTTPVESGWAGIRDVQRRVAAADPKVGLASAVDIGDIYDIHPANKQQVGLRLALQARKLAYGDSTLIAAGPAPVSATLQGGAVTVRLDQPAVVQGDARPIGFELCDAAGACRFADTALSADKISLAVPAGFTPVKVRYAWADSPVVNLYGATGLPATPFELAIAP
ncbi:9-O-acetylesterase [Caulobacter sp. Root655]|uniref:sialate O-acetylesterase n=1 Tax=Caulobacter sp. Root655 TaxID=1736578 RepID=UPI0006FA817B|nr:sialate O-acetylesterase [Caulobacter sp. Root655]KRA59643.1 9-O-acetylesterase [Caulobacter sp. Root655]